MECTRENLHFFIRIEGLLICLLFLFTVSAVSAQDRGSIPEELLRPSWGESPRYPADTVIGELGRGRASDAAYLFANSVASALMSRQRANPFFASVSPALMDSYLNPLGRVVPQSFRLGGGREEADGAVSFLVRYIGRDFGVTGELYVRYVTRQVHNDDGETTQTGSWVFEELLFEEVKSREEERRESVQRAEKHRLNYTPYERFF